MTHFEPETSRELLSHASRLLASVWNGRLTGLGITYAGYLALSAATTSPTPRQSAIAQSLHVKTPTAGGILDRLEQQGHVITYHPANDSRCRMVHITPRGRQVLQVGREIEKSLLTGAEGLRAQLLQVLPPLLQPGVI